ncbi:hypothetical protein [Luteimonas salinilitoris]|uniref:Transposase n=1 Tax=Luteimonas salinilitoris TaxID=3237697 RepID=A0ABV4HRQ9_9GAMM
MRAIPAWFEGGGETRPRLILGFAGIAHKTGDNPTLPQRGIRQRTGSGKTRRLFALSVLALWPAQGNAP